jgi:CheY-like chemotaxis protein
MHCSKLGPDSGGETCGTIHQAPAPERPIAKGLASPGLLAHVMVAKYCDHLPQGAHQSFQSVGLEVEAFGSAPEMLQSKLPDVASCLVLDIRLPGLSGLDFQTELAKANSHIPCRSTAAQRQNASRTKIVKSNLGLNALGLDAMNSKRFGLSHQIGQ